jgi:hypothetical protein
MLELSSLLRLLTIGSLLLSAGAWQVEPDANSIAPNCGAVHCAFLPVAPKSDLIGISPVKVGSSGKFTWAAQGAIFNASDKPIYNAKVELQITNLDTQVVITREVNTGLTGTLPGQANPFRFEAGAFPANPRVSVAARVKDASTTYTSTLKNLEVVSYTAHLFDCIGSCLGGVSVQVRNPYTFGVLNVRLLVWTSDSFCRLLDSVPVTTTLAAGASFQYQWAFCYEEMVLYPTSDLYIVAQGEVAP